MRFTRRARVAGPSDDRRELLAAARAGSTPALAVLRADLDPACLAALATLLLPGSEDALAVVSAAREATGQVALLEQVVSVLLDGGRRSPALVAELLELPVPQVLAARQSDLARSGLSAEPPGCRGWVLVGGGEAMTPSEQAAALAHLARCRRCTAARAASAQAVRRASVPAPRAARLSAP